MRVPNEQISWSQRAKLMWQIAKQLEKAIKVVGSGVVTTTTTSTTV